MTRGRFGCFEQVCIAPIEPKHYLCDVIRDALDEEASDTRIRFEPSGWQVYDPMGSKRYIFKEDSVGSAHCNCGGLARNRTGVQGFAVLCVTTPPRGLKVARLQG